jgi:hypothetical protein
VEELRRELAMTRAEFIEFADVWQTGVSLGFDVDELKEITKELQELRGIGLGRERARQFVQAAESSGASVALNQATQTGDFSMQARLMRGLDSRQRQAIADVSMARRGAQDETGMARLEKQFANAEKLLDDMKEDVGEILTAALPAIVPAVAVAGLKIVRELSVITATVRMAGTAIETTSVNNTAAIVNAITASSAGKGGALGTVAGAKGGKKVGGGLGLGKVGMFGGLLAAGGMAMKVGSGFVPEETPGDVRLKAGLSAGGNILGAAGTGAGIGAMIGSVVPGVGTAVGGILGGLVGAVGGAIGS